MLTNHAFDAGEGVVLRYYLYTPENACEGMPLLTFLHGAGERGNSEAELPKLFKNALPKMIREQGYQLPSYAIFPQCPSEYRWSDLVIFIKKLILKVADELHSDRKRLYLAGISMGGFGTWSTAVAYPELFAAIAPVCGGGLAWAARERLRDMPIWAFHGEADSIVLCRNSEEMVSEINRFGGKARLTTLPGVEHNSWDYAFEQSELLSWIYEQKKA